jgi:hypothetical protein
MVRKLSKVVKKLLKSCQKVVKKKRCLKVVKKSETKTKILKRVGEEEEGGEEGDL